MKTSFEILKEFIEKHHLKIDISKFINNKNNTTNLDLVDLPDDIVEKIISDAFTFSYKIIQKISDELYNNFGIHLSRIQKRYLKSFLIFRSEESFTNFKYSLNGKLNNNILDYIEKYINKYSLINFNEVKIFLEDIEISINLQNFQRTKDYLIFIYSRLLGMNEKRRLTLWDLFIENREDAKRELNDEEFQDLLKECKKSADTKDERDIIVYKFNKIYKNVLNKLDKFSEKYQVVYIDIDQNYINKFKSINELTNNILIILNYSYTILENHKTLFFRIKNIKFEGKSIKWLLYSLITLNAKNIQKEKAERVYYKPELVCIEVLQNIFKVNISNDDKNNLTNYFLHDNINYLNSLPFISNEIIELIDSFKNIYYGLSFVDCFILKTIADINNTDEINFIENKNELLIVLQKHELDKRKIPCPVCGSLKISGNSYQEVGIKSWECKNPNCFERSKTNRGKRFSSKSNFMQDEVKLSDEYNYIEKDLINIFRKDVIESWEDEDLISMIIKFYSYSEDKLFFISTYNNLIKKINSNRSIDTNTFDELFENLNIKITIKQNSFDNIFEKCIFHIPENEKIEKNKNVEFEDNNIKLIHGNALFVLKKMLNNSIEHMITSPPYYNAREYSSWPNIYTYLNDMFKIIKESHRVINDGGVFFFNIADIFDNDNTVTKSTMGKNRIPLGAYTLKIFQKVGFELLDNIIWYKGEPQSNRHKNDGMYYPYYQRPANSYEHIFIFKKPGELKMNNNFSENILKENIQKFSPVIKIGTNGVNRYGHTAPFPDILPKLSILSFTNKGDKVLDPFSGSGTVPLVAKQLDRIGIGIELNKDYFDLSKNKVKTMNQTKQLILL